MASSRIVCTAPASDNGRGWIGEYLTEMEPEMDAYLRTRLRRNLYSNCGDDVRQDTCGRLTVIFQGARFVGIDESNWFKPVPREVLDRCTFVTLRFTMLEWIRRSAKFDHGAEGLDGVIAEMVAPWDAAEVRTDVAAALRERPTRDQDFWRMAGIDGLTDAEIAKLWGISEVGVRVIRCRLLKWLRYRLG